MRFHAINEFYPPYNFQFPPPPQHPIMCNSSRLGPESCRNDLPSSTDESDTSSDSGQSDCYPVMPKMPSNRSNAMYKFRGYLSDGSPVSNILSILPPIGVFWDIENCQVRIKFVNFCILYNIVLPFVMILGSERKIRRCNCSSYTGQILPRISWNWIFSCLWCKKRKRSSYTGIKWCSSESWRYLSLIVDLLWNLHLKYTFVFKVNLIHVSSQSKNAADDKLRQAMRRFADIHGPPAAIMLISGDINFSSDLCDLRHR